MLAWIFELKRFSKNRFSDYEPLIPILEEAARSEKDAYYRYKYEHVASIARNVLAEIEAQEEEQRNSYGSSLFDDDDEEYDDDESEDDDYDDDEDDSDNVCDCAKCRAKRKRAQMHGVESKSEGASDLEEDQQLDRLPPIVSQVFSRLGPKGMVEFSRIVNATKNHSTPKKFVEMVGELLIGTGMSRMEVAAFIISFFETSERGLLGSTDDEEDDEEEEAVPNANTGMGSRPAPEMTAQERKASRKQREKELENKRSQANKNRSGR